MSRPSDKPPFNDSDRAWFDALTGEDSGAGDSLAAREGRMLRHALEERRQELLSQDLFSEAAGERQLKRLLDAAAAEGLVGTSIGPETLPRSNIVAFPWWRRRAAWGALAASVLVGAVLVGVWTERPDYPEPTQSYGRDGVKSARVATPKAAAELLTRRLRQAGLRPGLYQRGRVYIVDVNLLPSELEAVRPAYAEVGLIPTPGPNRVEFTAR